MAVSISNADWTASRKQWDGLIQRVSSTKTIESKDLLPLLKQFGSSLFDKYPNKNNKSNVNNYNIDDQTFDTIMNDIAVSSSNDHSSEFEKLNKDLKSLIKAPV